MASKKQDWLEKAEADIRRGDGDKVRKKLNLLQKRGVPNDQVPQVAHLARRVGMYHFATNLLHREVYQINTEPSQELLAEYALCLNGLGRYSEALDIFSKLPDTLVSHYAISYAGCHIHDWNYAEGLRILQKYRPSQWSNYSELVYGLNLASCFIETNALEEARGLLLEIKKVSDKESFSMLASNSMELLGQIEYKIGQYENAMQLFTESEMNLKSTKNVSWLYSLKWKSICEMQLKGVEIGSPLLKEVREQARKFLHWETLRDCDLHESILRQDSAQFNRVYFGTPSQAYRKMALSLSNDSFQLNPELIYGPKKKARPDYILDLNHVQFSPMAIDLEWTDLSKRLMLALTKDLYRPISIYQLHGDLFADEHYNPLSSKQKTYKVVENFRKLIENHPSGCTVDSRRHYGYRFRSQQPLLVIYPEKITKHNWSQSESFLQILKSNFGDNTFNRQDVCNVLSLTESSAIRKVKELHKEGHIEKIGGGRSTRYKFVS